MATASVLQKPKEYAVEEEECDERCPVLWSREDAQRLSDMGLIPERYELIEGVIYEKMGQRPPHRVVLNALYRWLAGIFGLEYLLSQQPVTLSLPFPNDGDLEPDITAINRPEPEFATVDPVANDIVMCVEIAYTSLIEDTTRKASIYAQNGIADYWVADVKKRQIIVHREPTADGYHFIKIYTDVEEVAPLSRPDAKILVGTLFPTLEPTTE